MSKTKLIESYKFNDYPNIERDIKTLDDLDSVLDLSTDKVIQTYWGAPTDAAIANWLSNRFQIDDSIGEFQFVSWGFDVYYLHKTSYIRVVPRLLRGRDGYKVTSDDPVWEHFLRLIANRAVYIVLEEIKAQYLDNMARIELIGYLNFGRYQGFKPLNGSFR